MRTTVIHLSEKERGDEKVDVEVEEGVVVRVEVVGQGDIQEEEGDGSITSLLSKVKGVAVRLRAVTAGALIVFPLCTLLISIAILGIISIFRRSKSGIGSFSSRRRRVPDGLGSRWRSRGGLVLLLFQ